MKIARLTHLGNKGGRQQALRKCPSIMFLPYKHFPGNSDVFIFNCWCIYCYQYQFQSRRTDTKLASMRHCVQNLKYSPVCCRAKLVRANVTCGIRGHFSARLPRRTRVLEAEVPSEEEAYPGSPEQAMGEAVDF